MGASSLFSYLLVSLFAHQALSQSTPPPCCSTKTVTDAPSGQDDLNGEYVLKPSATTTDSNCADGCVYTKDNEEYCFKNVPKADSANIVCDATTGGQGAAGSTPGAGASTPGAGASTPGAGAGTPEAGASTPGAGASTPGAGAETPGAGASTPGAGASTPGAGASTPGAGASTPGAGATTPSGSGTTQSLAATGQAAQETQARATAEKGEAEATKNAADESAAQTTAVQSTIDAVISGSTGTTAASGRIKRAVPTTCADFNNMVKEMNTEINKKNTTGFQKATAIGKDLVKVVASDIKCDTATLAALKTIKANVTAAQTVLTDVSAQLQSKITELTKTINAAIATIKEVNEKLIAAGQATFADPGTTLSVPTVATQAAAGQTTPAGGAGETSPDGGAGATTPGGGAGATTPAGGAGETTPGGGAGATSPAGGAGETSPSGGAVATTPAGGAGETSPAGGAGATTPAGGAGETSSAGGAGETTPAGGAGATMVSTAKPNGRQHLFGKRSRGSII